MIVLYIIYVFVPFNLNFKFIVMVFELSIISAISKAEHLGQKYHTMSPFSLLSNYSHLKDLNTVLEDLYNKKYVGHTYI